MTTRSLPQWRQLGTRPAYITPAVPLPGIVIAGFGDKEIFPGLVAFNTELIANGVLKYKPTRNAQISHELTAAVLPFAQSEMVYTFMEGVDPFYRASLEVGMLKLLDEFMDSIITNVHQLNSNEQQQLLDSLKSEGRKVMQRFKSKLDDYRKERHSDPVVAIVSILPKDELAEMAGSLVNLTSFKRKVSPDAETVGGPVDVAIVSKGDGFIWIKRKHYFDAESNPGFFANYYRR